MTQGTPVRSTNAQTAETSRARTDELVGDGSTVDAATFATYGVAECSRLFTVAPEKYRELQSELERASDLARMGRNR